MPIVKFYTSCLWTWPEPCIHTTHRVEVEGILVTFVTCNIATSTKSNLKYLVLSGFKMLPTNNSYYSSTSYPHRSSHCRPWVRDDRWGAGGETPLSKTRWGGICPAVAIAVAIAHHARPPTLGTPYRSRPQTLSPPSFSCPR